MGDVRLTVEKIVKTGVVATYNGPLTTVDTYLARNSGRVFVHCKKAGAGNCNAIFQTPAKVVGLDVAELTVVIPESGGEKFIGPFPPPVFNDGLSDLRVTFSEITGLTVAVLEV